MNIFSLEKERFLENSDADKFQNEFFDYLKNKNCDFDDSIPSPGEISNMDLLSKLSENEIEDYSRSPENYILKTNIDQNSEKLSIINQNQWNFFHSKFNGGPCIVRRKINYCDEPYSDEIEIQELCVNI